MSTYDLNFWQQAFRAFDPLRIGDASSIQTLYEARDGSPAQAIHRDLILTSGEIQHTHLILFGARGSGKSTELLRLRNLAAPLAHVVPLDAQHLLPEGANTLALLALLNITVAAALQASQTSLAELQDAQKLTTPPQESALTRLFERLHVPASTLGTIVRHSALVLKVFSFIGDMDPEIAQSADLAGQAMEGTGQLFRSILAQKELQATPTPNDKATALELVQTLNDLLKQLKDVTKKPPLLLIDGLDRIYSVERIRSVFQSPELLRDLRTHFVLTAPIAIRHTPEFRAVQHEIRTLPLHNVPIFHTPHGRGEQPEPNEHGIQTLLTIYAKRCAHAHLDPAFVTPEALRLAALQSAGIVRDFITFIHNAIREAFLGTAPIDEAILQRSIGMERRSRQEQLNRQYYLLLISVLQEHILPGGEDAAAANQLLLENFIACYANGDAWFRPHELLVRYIEEQLIPNLKP